MMLLIMQIAHIKGSVVVGLAKSEVEVNSCKLVRPKRFRLKLSHTIGHASSRVK
jgi:hypothetical protein